MTYNRVHGRGKKRITKNIQDKIWQREEWGKYMMCLVVSKNILLRNN